MKKIYLIISIIVILVAGFLFYRMKGNKVILVAIAIPMVAVLLAFLFIYLKGNSKSAENILPVDEYIIRPMSFAGNSYAFTASIVSQLAYSDTRGRIILVKPQSANGQLPILVPPTVENFNPQVSQIFTFWVKIDSEGKLIMTDFKKM